MRKIGYDIFVGDKPPKEKKPTRSTFIIILVVLVLVAAGFFSFRYINLARPPRIVIVEEKSELKIYYPSPRAKLIVKNVPIKNTLTDKEKADTIITSLKSSKALPETISLADIVSDGEGTLILNFSPDMTVMKLDPLKEIQTVYSIVNSFLASFTKARKVQLLSGGQPLYTLGGTVYTYKPLEFNSYMLED